MSCGTEGCKHETEGRKFCGTCRSRKSRLADPVRYAFNNSKHRAKERNIPWELTLEQFRQFCIKTDYITAKGKTIGSFNIDRIKEGPDQPYSVDNIQSLEKVANIKKYYDHIKKKAIKKETPVSVENLPF